MVAILDKKRINNYDVYFPPAEYWLNKKGINLTEFSSIVKNSKIDAIDSVYIHFPFCPVACKFCPYIKLNNQYMADVSSLMLKEIDCYAKLIKKVKINSLLFGGGTPNFMPIGFMDSILNKLKSNLDISGIKQVAIELRPGIEYKKHILTLLKYFSPKVIHISLGLQSAYSKKIKFCWRATALKEAKPIYYTRKDVENMITFCHKNGIVDINVDFMLGNYQDLKNEEKCIRILIKKFKVNKITLYPLFAKFMERRDPTKKVKQWGFNEMKNIRREGNRFLAEFNLKPAIWPNYFVKKGLLPNLESLTQFKGTTLIAIGPSARGNIRTKNSFIFYQNAKDYEFYKNKLSKDLLPVEVVYRYPKQVNEEISDEIRLLFIDKNKGLKKETIKRLIELSGPKRRLFEKLISTYFDKKENTYFVNEKGFYFIECIYWAIWDLVKEGFAKKSS